MNSTRCYKFQDFPRSKKRASQMGMLFLIDKYGVVLNR